MITPKIIKLATLCLLVFALLGCSSKPDVEVTIGTNPNMGTLVFDVQATNDQAVLKNIVINRGNCKLPPGTAAEIERTVNLGFGQSYRGYAYCKVENVKEIQATTSGGTFVFSF